MSLQSCIKKTLKYAVKAVIKHINEIETLHTCYFV